eukprot:scaffold50492_cov84-Phaeocystis_antarctica.AAC.2
MSSLPGWVVGSQSHRSRSHKGHLYFSTASLGAAADAPRAAGTCPAAADAPRAAGTCPAAADAAGRSRCFCTLPSLSLRAKCSLHRQQKCTRPAPPSRLENWAFLALSSMSMLREPEVIRPLPISSGLASVGSPL